jgi:hypothetical protein
MHRFRVERNQIILSKETQRKVKQKLVKRTIDKLPVTFPYLFKAFLKCKKPPARNNWFENLEKWSYKASVTPNFDSKKDYRINLNSAEISLHFH